MESAEAVSLSEMTGGRSSTEGADLRSTNSGTGSTAGSRARQLSRQNDHSDAGPSTETVANPSTESSGSNSRDESIESRVTRGHHRVRFGLTHSEGDLPGRAAVETAQQPRGTISPPKSAFATPKRALTRSFSSEYPTNPPAGTPKHDIPSEPLSSALSNEENDEEEREQEDILFIRDAKVVSQRTAENKAKELSRQLETGQRSKSMPALPAPTENISPPSPSPTSRTPQILLDLEGFPLEDLEKRREYALYEETISESEEKKSRVGRMKKSIRQMLGLKSSSNELSRVNAVDWSVSGYATPIEDRYDRQQLGDSAQAIRPSALSALLTLRARRGSQEDLEGAETPRKGLLTTPKSSPPPSGQTTPKNTKIHVPDWHDKGDSRRSSASLGSPFESSTPAIRDPGSAGGPMTLPRSKSSSAIETVKSLGRKKKKGTKRYTDVPQQVEVHIDDLVARHKYILKCCRAMMKFGAPTHRLEEYMRLSARALGINGQFLYIPGCMIISFDDAFTHTAEVKVVRENQGVDLQSRLVVVHQIYKAVLHDKLGPKDAYANLTDLMQNKPKFKSWMHVVTTGLASAFVGPFAFNARLIDMPIAFILGALLGFIQYIMSPKSDHYTDVFEIFAAILTSFFARLFGSLRGGNLFCFSALAQSSIALILPGYVVLCAALELQSRNIVAGSVRMVYAIIYSLFLGFGIMIGSSIYGAIDPHASSQTTCANATDLGYWRFAFVPLFTACLCVINHAQWRDMRWMLPIAFCGYVVNFFSAQRFPQNPQIANALGALTIGVMGNLHSRLGHGVSAAMVMPAIFVQVPSGLAAGGSLISGIAGADQIVANSPVLAAAANVTAIPDGSQVGQQTGDVQSVIFNVGASMIRVAVGLTVGLFVSSVVVYPLPKRTKRSGLFSF